MFKSIQRFFRKEPEPKTAWVEKLWSIDHDGKTLWNIDFGFRDGVKPFGAFNRINTGEAYRGLELTDEAVEFFRRCQTTDSPLSYTIDGHRPMPWSSFAKAK